MLCDLARYQRSIFIALFNKKTVEDKVKSVNAHSLSDPRFCFSLDVQPILLICTKNFQTVWGFQGVYVPSLLTKEVNLAYLFP